MMEYIAQRLNEGERSENLFVQSLTVPALAKSAKNYRLEISATPLVIEKTSPDPVEGWTDWGATRLRENMLQYSAEEWSANVGSDEHPLPMVKIMVSRAAFEVLIAEHGLRLLKVSDPRAAISQRMLKKELELLNSLDPITRAFKGDVVAKGMQMLDKELGGPSRAEVNAEPECPPPPQNVFVFTLGQAEPSKPDFSSWTPTSDTNTVIVGPLLYASVPNVNNFGLSYLQHQNVFVWYIDTGTSGFQPRSEVPPAPSLSEARDNLIEFHKGIEIQLSRVTNCVYSADDFDFIRSLFVDDPDMCPRLIDGKTAFNEAFPFLKNREDRTATPILKNQ
jgi:hypothetical protein